MTNKIRVKTCMGVSHLLRLRLSLGRERKKEVAGASPGWAPRSCTGPHIQEGAVVGVNALLSLSSIMLHHFNYESVFCK